MPVQNGLTTQTKSRNNPNGDRIHLGVMVDTELFKQFQDMCESKCLQKTAVLRRLVSDFVETQKFQGES